MRAAGSGTLVTSVSRALPAALGDSTTTATAAPTSPHSGVGVDGELCPEGVMGAPAVAEHLPFVAVARVAASVVFSCVLVVVVVAVVMVASFFRPSPFSANSCAALRVPPPPQCTSDRRMMRVKPFRKLSDRKAYLVGREEELDWWAVGGGARR